MSAPPVPPLPPKPRDSISHLNPGPPPPIPPLPPDIRKQEERYNSPSPYELESPPHFENPLIAPRPHRLDRSIPTNMARTLDDQIYTQTASINYAPGFVQPSAQPWTQHPPPPPQQQQQQQYTPLSQHDLAQSLANLSMTSVPQPLAPGPAPPAQLASTAPAPAPSYTSHPALTPAHAQSLPPLPQRQPTPPSTLQPSLTAPLPILSQLLDASTQIQSPTHDPALRIAWCRDVFVLVDRASGSPPATDPIIGPISLNNPALERLARIAIPIILQLAGSHTGTGKMPLYVAEAIAMRANFAASGAFPDLVRHNPRTAFRDFETAARGGYIQAWFRLGRDYENFNDHAHARDCFERGAKFGVESCLYRIGMAHLLGQLSLPSSPSTALPLLHRAAQLSSLSTPQPAYVYALLLLSEFTQITLPPTLFSPFIPAGSSPTLEARKHLERAAYLHFGAAQYKLGHAYEFAEPPFAFDPLLSVQYYSLASQQGEVEADMALSKWFLCGSGGAAAAAGQSAGAGSGGFEKDEGLALTFAEKAARKGLPSAEFAMGYYAEVGVGQPRDLNKAIEWYHLAKSHGNTDAPLRLAALSAPTPHQLSRQEHDSITETKLVRRRTQAAQRAESQPLSPPWEGRTFPTGREVEERQASLGTGAQMGALGQGQGVGAQGRRRQDGRAVVDVIRKNSVMGPAGLPIGPASAGRGRYPSSAAVGAGAGGGSGTGTGSPQRRQSPARRTESPGRIGVGAQGGRGQSPGGGRRVASGGAPNANVANMTSAGTGGPPTGTGTGQTRLERMRLNLDDPASSSPSSGIPTSASQPHGVHGRHGHGHAHAGSLSSSASYPNGASGVGYALTDPPVSSVPTTGALATPRPHQGHQGSMGNSGGEGGGGGSGAATPQGKKPQTFAEMGFQGAKAEDKDCVVM